MPALLILLITLVVGAGYLTSWGKHLTLREIMGASDGALADIEATIQTGKPTAATWRDYGNLLLARQRYVDAADAMKRAMELDAADQDLRVQYGLALAAGKNRDGFLEFMGSFVFSEPKLAMDLFERPECRGYLNDPAFAPLYKDAKGQAVD